MEIKASQFEIKKNKHCPLPKSLTISRSIGRHYKQAASCENKKKEYRREGRHFKMLDYMFCVIACLERDSAF